MAFFQEVHRLDGVPQVVDGHQVGVKVVIDFLVILVWPLDVENVEVAVVALRHPAGPEARRLHEDLGSRPHQELLVQGGVPVGPDPVSHVRGDVLFPRAGEDGDDLAGGGEGGRRGHLLPASRRFPGVLRPLVAVAGRVGPGAVQGVVTVHDHGARRGGMGEDEEGEDEHLRVPEDVALVYGAGKRASPDGDALVLVVAGTDEVIGGEVGPVLGFGVAGDAYRRCLPALLPGCHVL